MYNTCFESLIVSTSNFRLLKNGTEKTCLSSVEIENAVTLLLIHRMVFIGMTPPPTFITAPQNLKLNTYQPELFHFFQDGALSRSKKINQRRANYKFGRRARTV